LHSHCGNAGTIILILCYGNWHKVYRDVRYGMSCGSPLLSSMCICEWTKTKNQRIQAKDVLVLCILLAGDFFVLSGRLFCLQHIQLIHPRPPPSPHPPPFKTVCLSKDRAVSRVQSQGQKFFDYSTCNWYPALIFFSQGQVEKDKRNKKKSPKFSLFTAKISKTLSLL
jgi:hypothetical protein